MRETEPAVFHYLKFKSDTVVAYPSFELFHHRRTVHSNSVENLVNGKTKDFISMTSSKELTKRAEIWISSIQAYMKAIRERQSFIWKYVTFVTLTLSQSQEITDKEAKRRLLNTFLIYIRRHYNVKTFIWKAEKQGNGNIHFHILIDRYINHIDIRNTWNKIQFDNNLLLNFYKKHGHFNANSTDIHSLKGVNRLVAYMIEYMKKSEKEKPIEGRYWGSSDNLRSLSFFTQIDISEYRDLLNHLNKKDYIEKFEGVYFKLYSGPYAKEVRTLFPRISREIRDYYKMIFHELYQDSQLPKTIPQGALEPKFVFDPYQLELNI